MIIKKNLKKQGFEEITNSDTISLLDNFLNKETGEDNHRFFINNKETKFLTRNISGEKIFEFSYNEKESIFHFGMTNSQNMTTNFKKNFQN